MHTIQVSDREFHTILAALRYWQGVDSSFDTIPEGLQGHRHQWLDGRPAGRRGD